MRTNGFTERERGLLFNTYLEARRFFLIPIILKGSVKKDVAVGITIVLNFALYIIVYVIAKKYVSDPFATSCTIFA